MTAPEHLTWDADLSDGGARRPSIDDLGGAVLEDDAEHRPARDGRMLYDAMANQWQRQLEAIGQMVPSARLTIAFDAGEPYVAALMCASCTLVAADFTLTDNGVGDVTIEWPSGRLPAMVCDPTGNTNAGAASTDFDAERLSATSIRVRVRAADVPADVRFTVAIH